MNLEDLRKEIDQLDAKLVELLNERTRVALDIGRQKQETADETYAPAREVAVRRRLEELNPGPLPDRAIQAIYREILSASRALQGGARIAFLGPSATFTHQAARGRFGASVEYIPAETITEVFSHVQRRKADYGVVPIENSTEGAVTHTLDQFMDTPLKICAEIYLAISLNLMAAGGKEDIRRIYSKGEVFGQCRRWLHENMPGVELIPVSSTARAAEMAAHEPAAGALAGALAAELNGLKILAEDVQDLGSNMTRFLVIGPQYGAPTGRDKTSLLFTVRHKVGALYDALASFKQYNLNMTKIESRPSKTKAWEYCFFVDVEGHADDAEVKPALAALQDHCIVMTVLGSYPRVGDVDA